MFAVAEELSTGFGSRLFDIRARLGDGPRKPLSLRAFDDAICEMSGRRIHASELSRMERNERAPLLQDVEVIALTSPRGRELVARYGAGR